MCQPPNAFTKVHVAKNGATDTGTQIASVVTNARSTIFRARLDQIISLKHELVRLAGKIDWDFIDREIAPLYSDKGRPGIETRS